MPKKRGGTTWTSAVPLGLIPLTPAPVLNEHISMQDAASVSVALCDREVCQRCGHLHRDALRARTGVPAKCQCCNEKGGHRAD